MAELSNWLVATYWTGHDAVSLLAMLDLMFEVRMDIGALLCKCILEEMLAGCSPLEIRHMVLGFTDSLVDYHQSRC